MQTMVTTTRDLSTSTMVGQTLPSLHSKHPLRYSESSSPPFITCTVLTRNYAPFLLVRFSYKYMGGLIIE